MDRTKMLNPTDIDQMWLILQGRLLQPGYEDQYATEAAFEADVWKRIVGVATDLGIEVGTTCLTSHAVHAERSVQAWERFMKEERGPLLGLWHRDRTIVAIHCGTVEAELRDKLRRIGEKICNGTKTAVLVVP